MTRTDVDIQTAALEYAARGWYVFPVRGKRPAPGIKSWTAESTTDPAQIVAWYSGTSGLGIGVDMAKSRLVAVDGDHLDRMPPEVWEAVQAVTRSAWTHQGNRARMTWVMHGAIPQAVHQWGEVKGPGGYIVLAPSPHPDQDEPYQWVNTPGDAPGEIPDELAALVAPRTHEEGPRRPWDGQPLSEYHLEAARALVDDLGGRLAETAVDRNWTTYAYANRLGHYVPHLLSAEEVTIALLKADRANGLLGEDGVRSVKRTIRSGLERSADEPEAPDVLPPWEWEPPSFAEETPGDPWAYGGDLRTVEEEPDQPPDLLTRSDGLSLLYKGGVHNIVGESESGKSWLAIAAIVENARRGQVSIYVDFEDHRRTSIARLLALGLTREEMGQVHYYAADGPWGTAPEVLLDRHSPSLVVIDATSEAMGSFGLDPTGTVDAVTFVRWVRIWASQGAALVLIDHVVKDKNSQGRWSLGSQHKVAGVQAHYVVEPIGALVPGERSSVLIKVGKNRAGHVRAGSTPPTGPDRLQVVGVFHFGGDPAELAWWELVPMEDGPAGHRVRPSEAAEQAIKDLLRPRDDGLSKAKITAILVDQGHTRQNLRDALERLVANGQVARRDLGGRTGQIHTLVDLFADCSPDDSSTNGEHGEQTAR